jgi:hypothetical protein
MVNSERFQQNFTFVSQCDIKYMMTLPIKTSTSVLKFSPHIILSDSLRY